MLGHTGREGSKSIYHDRSSSKRVAFNQSEEEYPSKARYRQEHVYLSIKPGTLYGALYEKADILRGYLPAAVLQFGVTRNAIVEVGISEPTPVSPRTSIYWASILSIDLQCTWVYIMRSNVGDGNVSPIEFLA